MSDNQLYKLAKFPVFYDLAGKVVLIAGDNVALIPKARLLAMTGARVNICAPDMKTEFDDLRQNFKLARDITFAGREWCQDDLQNAALAIGAFSAGDMAARFCTAARSANVPVNLVDRPTLCDFQIPVIVNRSPLIIGISTGGAAPVIGQWLRGRLESLLPHGTGAVLEVASALRDKINARLKKPAARRAFWKKLAEQDLTRLSRAKSVSEIEQAVLERLEKTGQEDYEKGKVLLISVPERTEDMPLKTLCLLQNADVIVRSGDVDPEYLDFCRRDAVRIEEGAVPVDIQQIIFLARTGQYIIWLHGKTSGRNMADTAALLSSAGIAAPAP